MLFSRSFQTQNRDVCDNEILPWLRQWKGMQTEPTTAHYFCRWLADLGVLRRVYTQNIDGLHTKGGLLPDAVVVEAHGSLHKDNVVLYEDALPPRFYECLRQDFPRSNLNREGYVGPDLVVVMGTSLQVAPFCAVPNLGPPSAVRVLISLDIAECLQNGFSKSAQHIWETGLSANDAVRCTSVRLAGRLVTLRPRWLDRKAKWEQYLVNGEADAFCALCMANGPVACC